MFKKILTISILCCSLYASDSSHLSANDFNLYWLIPFFGILLSIAILPLIASSLWHNHYGKVSLFWGLLFLILFLINFYEYTLFYVMEVLLLEFLPFIMLLLALYTVSGGILITGNFIGTPKLNTFILIIGTFLASIMGTTGASMLLIRPIIRANKWRANKIHIIIFFIFLVSNIGGSLTPIGDPPLFLGFLKGVSFSWPLVNMFKPMILISAILLIIHYFVDKYFYQKEKNIPKYTKVETKISGKINFLLIVFIVIIVIISALPKLQGAFISYHNTTMLTFGSFVQIILLLTITLVSMQITPKIIREKNEFTWEPIKEVAKLFATIFLTMIPAIEMLKGVSKEIGPMKWMKNTIIDSSGNNVDYMYFWLTGILSSFLDNAPTYLVFFTTALGENNVEWLMNSGNTLLAISTGAVFMGAMTYIGNAPNFMVKSIAEQSKINMPSFFGYMFWSTIILMPLLILVNFIFF